MCRAPYAMRRAPCVMCLVPNFAHGSLNPAILEASPDTAHVVALLVVLIGVKPALTNPYLRAHLVAVLGFPF